MQKCRCREHFREHPADEDQGLVKSFPSSEGFLSENRPRQELVLSLIQSCCHNWKHRGKILLEPGEDLWVGETATWMRRPKRPDGWKIQICCIGLQNQNGLFVYYSVNMHI